MAELNIWEQKVISELLSFKNPDITLVKEIDFFNFLFFNHNQYEEIITLIKAKNWESLKNFKNENLSAFQEDLVLLKFTNQNNEVCIATIYDSNELWQDPEIMDVFVLTNYA